MRCPICQFENIETAKFCNECGTRISGLLLQSDANIIGSGAIAQGNSSLAVGANGIVVSGSVFGNIYHSYQKQPGNSALTENEFRQILGEYLHWIRKAYNQARLYGIDCMPITQGKPIRQLKDVFVPLTLYHFRPYRNSELSELAEKSIVQTNLTRIRLEWADHQSETNNKLDLRELITASDRIALVGCAGSGKSTILAYLILLLAESIQDGKEISITLPHPEHLPVPFLIPLRYYHAYMDLCAHSHREQLNNPRVGTLAGFIPWYLKRRSPALELSEDFFDRLLLGGGCLLMLDGVDEVINRDQRGQLRQEIENLVNDIYPGNQVLVTAREAGYREEAVFSDDFLRLDIERLDEKQIQALCNNWCYQLYPEDAELRSVELIHEITELNSRRIHRDLPPLISTPLMTTIVVSVKWSETELPRERAKLYEAYTKVILQAQYIQDDISRKDMVEWGGVWEAQREWLSLLALDMHSDGAEGIAIREEKLRQILASHLSPDALDRFIQAIRYRGGLLEERAEFFQFIHLTFQEFLSARLLAKQRQDGWPSLLPYIRDPWWREVILLIYGFARTDYPPAAQAYLDWLSNLDPSDEETRLAGLELAGAAVLELEWPDDNLRALLAKKLLEMLRDPSTVVSGDLRAKVGNTLAKLGDTRFLEKAWFLPNDPVLGFIHIPSGPFMMGTLEKDISEFLVKYGGQRKWYEDEIPQHSVTLPDYYIAQYPVTVAQFRAFVDASGYKPENNNSLSGLENHPVVSITWPDALKYCVWLTETLSKWTETPEPLASMLRHQSWMFTLPSEAEWEKAARGVNSRVFPWGNEIDTKYANFSETRIGGTCAVGCFPNGASSYGVEDMSGNIWEWTRNLWGQNFDRPEYCYPYKSYDGRENLEAIGLRIMRGGSYSNVAGNLRCSSRNKNHPLDPSRRDGFRVAFIRKRK